MPRHRFPAPLAMFLLCVLIVQPILCQRPMQVWSKPGVIRPRPAFDQTDVVAEAQRGQAAQRQLTNNAPALEALNPYGETGSSSRRLERLQTSLQTARLERMRWDRVITTQADLAQDPNKLAKATANAADELRSVGRSMTVEGFTMGLSSLFQIQAEWIPKRRWQARKKLGDISAGIVAAYKIFIEDELRGTHQPQNANAELQKASAAFKLMLRQANAETREEIEALVGVGGPAIELLSSLMRGDEITSEQQWAFMKDVAVGSRQMMRAFIEYRRPEDWVGRARFLAKAFPSLEKFLGVAAVNASKGLVVVNALNSLALASFGAYAWREGVQLEALAEDIRTSQQHAAVLLQALLPHARQARDSALRREARLERMIQSLQKGNSPSPPKLVPPSRHVLDDGVGVPPQLFQGLRSTLTVVQSSTPVSYHLTKNEVKRREEIARAERAAAAERARAARLAEERAQREQRQRDRGDSPRTPDDSRRSNIDTGAIQGKMQKVVNNVLPNW